MDNAATLTEVREAHRFDEPRLAAYLAEHLDGGIDAITVQQFEGGQSNPTFVVTANGREYVLRKKPPGKLLKSAHAVEREYRIMTALRDTNVPVPRTYHLCEDDSVMGTPFFIMDNVGGRVITESTFPGFTPDDRRETYDHFAQVLAALHQVDLAEVGLEDYGRPGNYYERQLSRWSKQYLAAQTEDIGSMNRLMEWLPAHVPASDETTIVHGDYRPGNCIVHATEPRIVAVLDWELSTLGHPLADLAYFCMYCFSKFIGDGGEAEGVPTQDEFVARYCELTGRKSIENWNFYMVFTLFRSAAIAQGVYKRGLDGNASSQHWQMAGEQVAARATDAVGMIDA